jgi:hypothetical protein
MATYYQHSGKFAPQGLIFGLLAGTAYLDDIVRDHSKTNPSLHAFKASIPAAIQSMTTLQYADTAFAASPPALPRLEPTRSLQFSPLTTFRAPARHRDSRYPHSLDGGHSNEFGNLIMPIAERPAPKKPPEPDQDQKSHRRNKPVSAAASIKRVDDAPSN